MRETDRAVAGPRDPVATVVDGDGGGDGGGADGGAGTEPRLVAPSCHGPPTDDDRSCTLCSPCVTAAAGDVGDGDAGTDGASQLRGSCTAAAGPGGDGGPRSPTEGPGGVGADRGAAAAARVTVLAGNRAGADFGPAGKTPYPASGIPSAFLPPFHHPRRKRPRVSETTRGPSGPSKHAAAAVAREDPGGPVIEVSGPVQARRPPHLHRGLRAVGVEAVSRPKTPRRPDPGRDVAWDPVAAVAAVVVGRGRVGWAVTVAEAAEEHPSSRRTRTAVICTGTAGGFVPSQADTG